MSKKSPPPAPPAPDPYQTAAAQTGSNVSTAIANSWLNNANETGPYGSVSYDVTGSHSVNDGMGHSYDVPTFSRTVSLSPEEQQLYNQQTGMEAKLNSVAGNQIDRINGILSSPIDTGSLPAAPTNSDDYRNQVEGAMYSRLNPQLERDRTQLDTQLVNSGLTRGSDAYNQQMDAYNRQANDARMQVLLGSGQEARAQQEQQATTRERALQEQLSLRNQPINEISTLMNGGQVSMPQFSQYRGGTVDSTPVGQYVYNTAQLNQQAWQQRAQMQAQNLGGLYSLGAAALGGLGQAASGRLPMPSDRRLKRDIARIGALPNGLPLYSYRYLWSDEPQVGVMADEVQAVMPEAVVTMPNGYKAVHYDMVLGA